MRGPWTWCMTRSSLRGPNPYIQEPHLVWPKDQAWRLACQVDEEFKFSVGSSVDASQALARALPGAVRGVHYGEPAPLYRDRA